MSKGKKSKSKRSHKRHILHGVNLKHAFAGLYTPKRKSKVKSKAKSKAKSKKHKSPERVAAGKKAWRTRQRRAKAK